MPWKESTGVEERKKLIDERGMQNGCFAELCRKHEISRQAGYKWLERF
jgi:hypothetical protein